MSNLQIVESRIHQMINEYKEKYFLIDEQDYLTEKIDESYEELLKIKNYIARNLGIKNFPRLMSKIYIDNRNLMREQNDQYRLEIRTKTQCLKSENTTYIDPNYEFEVLGFNQVPYVHFNYLGVVEGTYYINMLDGYSFGIAYDFEEFPNKEHGYDVLETTITLSGTEDGEPRKVIEDKYIRMPGDIDDDEHIDGILNIGAHEFEIQFYSGRVKMEITGDFGYVSYMVKKGDDVSYMGGQKRLKFSEVCLTANG